MSPSLNTVQLQTDGSIRAVVPYHHIQTYLGDHGNHSVETFEAPKRTKARVPSSAPFSSGSRENISNHTFNSVGGNMTQLNVTSYGESGINLLSRYVLTEALHDSGERFPEPACHPGTRTRILHSLKSWALDGSTESPLFWLHGSAGAGKSAIAQMFAGECQALGWLGASFFFKRRNSKRGTWDGLFPTIAYQLAKSVPSFLPSLQQAMDDDVLLVGRTMAAQFQHLLVEPFTKVSALQSVPIIILDGLDECADQKVQQQILQLFIGAVHEHRLPIHILISSRPEPHLREILESPDTLGMCRQSSLSADPASFEDIRIYLRDEFSRICAEYRTRGIELGIVWPSPDALDHLVNKFSGIFIYATTAIRFVEDPYRHPVDQLERILKLDPQSTAPLDDLYTEILSGVPHEPQTLRILHSIWQKTLPRGPGLDPEGIDRLFVLRKGTARLILRGLHSLCFVPSFRTYGQWCVSTEWLESSYLRSLIQLLSAPPVTDADWALYSEVVGSLPDLLRNHAPSDSLIRLLRQA
ncbi:hypothetical protein MVEN_02234600 [Mycena venus]|uniref:Nephrocystin 3-like N-terminal domain-containing protein n=1 Tax=Mycena venus TaxID=2733690 RepID=A0A8H7CGS6_9AGAR|nr:hypothetical protein MVEN_02234600 [Mycena venus]